MFLMLLMIMMMMMVMVTLMKLVNSGTKFRPGIDKFYQSNAGVRGSKTEDKAIYTGVCIQVYVCTMFGYTYTYIMYTYMYIYYVYV